MTLSGRQQLVQALQRDAQTMPAPKLAEHIADLIIVATLRMSLASFGVGVLAGGFLVLAVLAR